MPLDIGIGILSAILVAKGFSMPLAPTMLWFGILFALLPDIDGVYTAVRHGFRNHRAIARHRDLIHYPLVYLPLGSLLLALIGIEWSLLFLLASLGHFIHDSIGIGWGIPWFWPFTNRNYSFLYRYARPGKELPKRLIHRWERNDLDRLIDEYGDPNWLQNIYFRMHPFFLAEVVGLVIAVTILFQYTGASQIQDGLKAQLFPSVGAKTELVR